TRPASTEYRALRILRPTTAVAAHAAERLRNRALTVNNATKCYKNPTNDTGLQLARFPPAGSLMERPETLSHVGFGDHPVCVQEERSPHDGISRQAAAIPAQRRVVRDPVHRVRRDHDRDRDRVQSALLAE